MAQKEPNPSNQTNVMQIEEVKVEQEEMKAEQEE
jgi:hypothetical protein